MKGRSWSAAVFAASLLAGLLLLTSQADAGGYQLESRFGSSGSQAGEFDSPYGLAVLTWEGEDYLYVVDSGNDRVQIFDAAGEFQYEFGTTGSGEGEFLRPSGIAIGDDLTVYVADTGNSRVQVLDGSGGFREELGPPGAPGSALGSPVGVALDTQGDVLVTEATGNQVSRFDDEGGFLSAFGSPGSGGGSFSYPIGLAVDTNRDILVVDSFNHRLQRFTGSGQFVNQIGAPGSGGGQFNLPLDVVLGPQGMFVSDVNNHRIQQLGTDGSFVSAFGSFGLGDAGSGRPGWLATGSDGDLYMSDAETDAILHYSFRNDLTANRSGSGSGSVNSVPAGLECGPICSTALVPGASVTLTATPAHGSTFTGWSGGGCSGTGSCQVLMDGDRSVTANFTLDRMLSVTSTGQGSGTVTSAPAAIDCGPTCSATLSEGSSLTLSAAPAAGSTFAGWSGGGCSGTGPCTVTLDSDLQVSAGFDPVPDPVVPRPRVKLTGKPSKKTRSRTAKFRFRSSVPKSRFQCRLDRGRFGACRSPKTYRRLGPGRHKVSIRAVAAGRTGPTVTVRWTVRRR